MRHPPPVPAQPALPAAPHDLTTGEIAALMAPDNHPHPLTAQELDHLVGHLTTKQMDEVAGHLGVGGLVRQLPPVLLKVVHAVQRQLQRDAPPELDDEIDSLVRNFDVLSYIVQPEPAPPTTSVSSKIFTTPSKAPTTPAKEVPSRVSSASPSPPTPSGARASYAVNSPTKVGHTVSWFEAGALTIGVRNATTSGSGNRKPRKRSGRNAAYVVFYGGEVGVFEQWADASRSVTGHGLAIHCGFPSLAAANAALAYARTRGWTADSTDPSNTLPSASQLPASYPDNALNSTGDGMWYVVCRGIAPGVYRSWLECSLNTSGVKGNLCSSFTTQAAAEQAFASALKANFVQVLSRHVNL
ncbi:hypothetical protein C8F04DRAFT_1248539 [Mycena alexandri]|uniref:Ribonuclease H1 N-terminal domain-containing protein n=1 Tax=Mycena alexandri TaxID=1745969 RepID=A0AAD6TJ75_9AGAR|nr:hypothetical protein C8F04DRAFT_1248539 [Mycena alexandri]